MATNFPSSQDNFVNPTSSDTLDSPDHAAQHTDVNDAVEAIELALLDGAPLHIDDANERVGIGTVAPSTELEVDGTVTATEFVGHLQGPTHIQVKNTSGGSLSKGTPVYATGSVGASGAVEVQASLAGTASTMPALGLLDETLAHNDVGSATVLGVIRQVDTSSYSVNDELYVAVSGGLTATRPTGASELVQKIGRVVRSDASTGEILVLGAGRTNDIPNDIPYLPLSGGTVTGQTTFSATDGVKLTGSSGGVWWDDRNGDGSKWVMYHLGDMIGLWNGTSTPFEFKENGVGYATNWSVGTGSSANAFVGGSNYWRPQDAYGNSYFDINSGQFYVDSDTYYFRNRASGNSLVIDSAGNGTFTGSVTGQAFYASNWFRTYGEEGLHSESYGQHFYPDSGGSYWESDGPIRIRDGYEGAIQGYLGFHDTNGFGLLDNGGSWWLNTDNNEAQLVIGGSKQYNAHGSVTSRRLMFGGGDADAQGNYYIGTNMENYGGNYNKLDIFWHTGVRIAAMTNYGGIRMYGSISGGSVSNELFSVGKGDSHVRASNNIYAYAFRGHSNVAGTGEAVHAPAGVYSTGTNWLYGTILTNGSDIGQSSQRVGQVWSNGWLRTVNATGWYNDTYGGGVYMTGSDYVRVYNSKGLETNKNASQNYATASIYINASPNSTLSFHPGGQAPQLRVGFNNNTVYFRNWADTGWCVIEASVINHSSRVDKQDISDFANRPSSLSSDGNSEYARSGTDIVRQLRPRHYRWDWDKNMRQLPLSQRRTEALKRLNAHRETQGLGEFLSDESWHVCGRDCDGTETDPCWWVKDWETGYFGFIAEEVGEVVPEAGRLSETTGELSGLDAMAMSAIIVASLQEVLDRLDALESANV